MRWSIFLIGLLMASAVTAAPVPKYREKPAPPTIALRFDTSGPEIVLFIRVGAKDTRVSTCENGWEERLKQILAEARPRVANQREIEVEGDIEELSLHMYITTIRAVRQLGWRQKWIQEKK